MSMFEDIISSTIKFWTAPSTCVDTLDICDFRYILVLALIGGIAIWWLLNDMGSHPEMEKEEVKK